MTSTNTPAPPATLDSIFAELRHNSNDTRDVGDSQEAMSRRLIRIETRLCLLMEHLRMDVSTPPTAVFQPLVATQSAAIQ